MTTSGYSFLYGTKAINSDESHYTLAQFEKDKISTVRTVPAPKTGSCPVYNFAETLKYTVKTLEQICISQTYLKYLLELNAACISSL